MCRMFLVGLCIVVLCSGVWAQPLPGPFALNDGLTFYLVNPSGETFDLRLEWTSPFRKDVPRPFMVRVFDPQENLLLRHEFAGEPVEETVTEQFAGRIPAAGPGVYQVVIHSGHSVPWDQTTVDLQTTPELEFGVFGHIQWLTGMNEQFADTYVYLPPGLPKLPVETSEQLDRLTILDEDGTVQLELDRETRRGEVELPPAEGQVWRLQAQGPYYRLDFKGYPIILCPSEETARVIRASVDVMPDGTICFFKHQVAAWELLQQYKRRTAADYAVEVVPLADLAAALRREPARNQLLFGHYGVMSVFPAALVNQNLDPDSPWFGAIAVWQDEDGNPLPGNPMADYDRRGREAFASLNKVLAAMYWLDADFNPYHKSEPLLNRIIVAALLDLLVLREGEFCLANNTYYIGSHGFTLEHSHSGAFSLVYPDLPAEVQAVWHSGQQRFTDRLLYGTVGGSANQWTVLLSGLWRYCEGTGDEAYKNAVLRNLHWLIDGTYGKTGQRPAGYVTEALGPDATYNGITAHCMAKIFHGVQDPKIRESIRRMYELFNHTIAPEPDGRWLGSSGFCHRTPGDWVSPQYGAGLGPMSAHLPEAGVRLPEHPPWAYARPVTDEASRTEAEAALEKVMEYFDADFFRRESANHSRASGAFDIYFANWRAWSDSFLPGILPCTEEQSFTRNFGDEFFCVKRPAYYAFLYTGVAYQDWQKVSRPTDHMAQYPHNDGLCMVWSPEFGSSILTKNWGASRANTLLAGLDDGRVEWPWYLDVVSETDTENATVKLSGRITDTPLAYERLYRFLDDRIECTLTVTAAEPVTLRFLHECLPFPLEDLKPGMRVRLLDEGGGEVNSGGRAHVIAFDDAGGVFGHHIVLTQPLVAEVGEEHSVDHYKGEHDYGRVLLHLPAQWTANQRFELQYTLMPTRAEAR